MIPGFIAKKSLPALAAVLLALACLALGLPALAENPLGRGQTMPDLELPMPENAAQAQYLGLQPGGASFRLSQIKKPWLLIEIFNMYCTICQREAPRTNQLYQAISQGPLGRRLAMLGIGAGNSPFEVNAFRNRFRIAFPLFPDADLKIHEALGEPRTPYYILIKLGGPQLRIVLANLGRFGEPADFLADIEQALRAD
ncbi:hypothetical protein AAU61_04945 [Desulfocarbo indianensis]|nr:hypothetical protein AAU61_04945 [Desulfocarbo indianensis]